MSKAATKPNDQVVVEYADLSALWLLLTQVAFVLLMGLAIARVTMSQSLRDPFEVNPGVAIAPRVAGPASSVVLDLIGCLPALLVLARRVADKGYILRGSMSHAIFGAVAIFALCSTAWSGDKFAAIIASFHLVSVAASLWAATQLVRSWQRLRIVAGVCAAILLIYLAQGLKYRFVDLPDSVRDFEQNRDQRFSERGIDPQSFSAQQLEKKLRSGEMTGFLTSPNSFGALLVMLGIVTAGVVIQRFSDKDETGFAGALILALPITLPLIYWTQSKTAFVSLAIGGVLLAAVHLLKDKLVAHRKVLFIAGAAAVAVGIMGVVILGLINKSLPSASMDFRWKYWVGGARLVAQHPLIGVGYANFGDSYLAVRQPEAAEEIKDPHNFLVRGFVELGLIGGFMIVAWLVLVWWEMTRPSVPSIPKKGSEGSIAGAVGTIAAVVAVALAVNLTCSIDFTLGGSSDATWWVVLELMLRSLFAGMMILGLALVCIKSVSKPVLDDRPAMSILWAMIVAVAVLMIQNLVDFSLFEPGILLLAGVVIGAILGVRMPSAAGKRKQTAPVVIVTTVAMGAWIFAVVMIGVPVVDAESRVATGDVAMFKKSPQGAATEYKNAFDNLRPKNADYALRAARAAVMAGTQADFVLAGQMYSEAAEANPKSVTAQLNKARFLSRAPGPLTDKDQAMQTYRRAIELNPNDAGIRIEFGEFLRSLQKSEEAKEQFREALRRNDLLDRAEPRRLNESELKRLQDLIEK